MIVVRNTFTAKPGQASTLAKHLKEMAKFGGLPKFRILTDMTGDFNSVVMEFQVESLAALEEFHQKYMTDPKIREKSKGYTDLWTSGSRTLYQVV